MTFVKTSKQIVASKHEGRAIKRSLSFSKSTAKRICILVIFSRNITMVQCWNSAFGICSLKYDMLQNSIHKCQFEIKDFDDYVIGFNKYKKPMIEQCCIFYLSISYNLTECCVLLRLLGNSLNLLSL